jgi:hypothetical protein
MTTQDFQKRLDITGLTEITGSQINQSVETAYPADDKGLIIETTDTAVDVPEVPDPNEELESVTPTYWTRYLWKRNPHADDDENGVRLYAWNPNAESHATFLKWEDFDTVANEALELAEEALETAEEAATNATTALTQSTNAVNTANAATASIAGINTSINTINSQILDLIEDGIFQGSNNGSSETVIRLILSPKPPQLSLYNGMKVAFTSPVTCGNTVRLEVYEDAETIIGSSKFIGKFNQVTRDIEQLDAGDIVSGQKVEVTYDGTMWQLTTPVGLSAVGNGTTSNSLVANKNLIVTNNSATPDTQIDVNADEVVVSNGTSIKTLFNVDLTINALAAVGANGPDIAIDTDVFYYVFVIYNPTTNTTAGLISESPTAPTLPSGYTLFGLVSSIYRAGAVFNRFYQRGNNFWYVTTKNIFTSKNSGVAANTYVTLSGADLTAFEAAVPPIAKHVMGIFGEVAVSGGQMGGAIAADADGLAKHIIVDGQGGGGAAVDTFGAAVNFILPLKTRNLFWKTNRSSSDAYARLDVVGFEL